MRTGQFVWIGVVHDDVAVARKRWSRTVTDEPDGAWQLHRAVLVGILQTRVDQNGRRAALEERLQIFLADTRNRHGRIVIGRCKAVNLRAAYWATVRWNGMTRALAGEGTTDSAGLTIRGLTSRARGASNRGADIF
jgi:hypothetical protein